MTQRRSRSRLVLAPSDDGDLFEPLVISIEDAALVTGCSPTDVRRMIAKRQIESVHLGNARLAIKARSLINVCGERLLLVRNPQRAHELDGTPFPRAA